MQRAPAQLAFSEKPHGKLDVGQVKPITTHFQNTAGPLNAEVKTNSVPEVTLSSPAQLRFSAAPKTPFSSAPFGSTFMAQPPSFGNFGRSPLINPPPAPANCAMQIKSIQHSMRSVADTFLSLHDERTRLTGSENSSTANLHAKVAPNGDKKHANHAPVVTVEPLFPNGLPPRPSVSEMLGRSESSSNMFDSGLDQRRLQQILAAQHAASRDIALGIHYRSTELPVSAAPSNGQPAVKPVSPRPAPEVVDSKPVGPPVYPTSRAHHVSDEWISKMESKLIELRRQVAVSSAAASSQHNATKATKGIAKPTKVESTGVSQAKQQHEKAVALLKSEETTYFAAVLPLAHDALEAFHQHQRQCALSGTKFEVASFSWRSDGSVLDSHVGTNSTVFAHVNIDRARQWFKSACASPTASAAASMACKVDLVALKIALPLSDSDDSVLPVDALFAAPVLEHDIDEFTQAASKQQTKPAATINSPDSSSDDSVQLSARSNSSGSAPPTKSLLSPTPSKRGAASGLTSPAVVKQPVKAVTTTRKHTASRPTLSDDAVQLLVREELQKAMQSMKIELRQELSAADQTKLLEKEVSRQAHLDINAARDEKQRATARAAELERIVSDQDARHKALADDLRRPNHILSEAESEISRLRSHLLPLLDEAEKRMQKMEGRHFVGEGALLRRIAAVSGRSIVQNSDALCEALLDELLADTVQVLNRQEQLQRLESDQQSEQARLQHALTLVDAFTADLDRAREELSQLPKIAPVVAALSPVVEQPVIASKAPASQHTDSYQTALSPLPSQSTSDEVIHSAIDTSSSFTTKSNILLELSLPLPASDDVAARAALRAAAVQRNWNKALPVSELSELIQDVRANRDRFEKRRSADEVDEATRLAERFGDEMIEDMLRSVSQEFGTMCDGMVERMIMSEFA